MKNFTKLSLFTILLATILFSSCKKEYDSIEAVDEAAIQAYIKANNLTSVMTRDASGSYYQVIDAGSGTPFVNKDSVFFTYQEKSITDGTVYYTTPANSNSGTYFGYMTETSNGTWGAALKGLKYGAKVRILVPSRLAYGKNGNATFNVPSNAVLDTYITTLNYKTQTAIDEDRIKTFLAAKGLTASAIRDPSTGIYYIVTQLGTGASIIDKETGTAVVNYTGRNLNGTVFDSLSDGSFSTSFGVGAGIIEGWKAIIPKFPAGSKIRFFLPSAYAYGIQGRTDQTTGIATIPPNSVLDFDVEIVSVTN